MARTRTEGLEVMRRRMRAIPRHIRAEMESTLEQNAEELTGMQKRLAPVDEGDLRSSIRWMRGTLTTVRGWFGRGRSEVDRENMIVTVFTDDPKARWVEYGTESGVLGGRATYVGPSQSKAGRRQRRTHSGTSAQPFFFPAYRSLKRRLKSRMSRNIGKAVRRGVR
jgi:hypothetical protein